MSTSASLPVLHTTYTYTYSGTFMYGVLCMLVVFGGHRGDMKESGRQGFCLDKSKGLMVCMMHSV